jgi:plastocyanin
VKLRVGLFGLLFFYQALAWSDIAIRVTDKHGQPVENAVVSLSLDSVILKDQATVSEKSGPSVMDQIDKQFSPHVLVVEKGQQVTFPNSDQIRHHVYSFSKPNDFEIKLYSGNQAEPVRFEHPGIAVLGCNIHDQMVAYIYIADQEITGITDTQGRVHFEGVTPLNETALQVTVWHSRLSSSKTERSVQTLGSEQLSEGGWQVVLELQAEITRETRKFKPRFQ